MGIPGFVKAADVIMGFGGNPPHDGQPEKIQAKSTRKMIADGKIFRIRSLMCL
jgi:hypothetical protein